MMNLKRYLLAGVALAAFAGFRWDTPYETEIQQWHQQREAALRKEDGWLNLAGLFWLTEGKNSFGADDKNAIVFPRGKSDARLGYLVLSQDSVTLEAAPKAQITHQGKPVKKMTIFGPSAPQPIVLEHQSLRWVIIKRGNRYGVRLRDLKSPLLASFKGIETFPVDPAWRVEARLVPSDTVRHIPITDVLGMTHPEESPGTLVFEVAGQTHRLDAVKSGDKLFILFSDPTNASESYATGRFLYADKPGADGKTILDFNKAINPPCAFTDFATCPLPPRQNRLAVAVRAGEKRYGHHE